MADQEVRTLEDLGDAIEGGEAAEAAAPREPQIDAQGRAYATGKRKNAVARVWIKPGSGRVTVNGRDWEQFFARPVLRMILQQPLEVAGRKDQYDVTCTVAGGGLSGQAGAGAPRPVEGADLFRAGIEGRPQAGRFPDP